MTAGLRQTSRARALAGGAARLWKAGLRTRSGRVAGKEKLRREHQVRAEPGGLRARLAQPAEVALDIPTIEAICASAMTRRLVDMLRV